MKEVFFVILLILSLISSMNFYQILLFIFLIILCTKSNRNRFSYFAFRQLSFCTSLDGKHIVSRNCYDTPFSLQ